MAADAPHEIWELSDGYTEGMSAQPTPEGSTYRASGETIYGWFCIEGTPAELEAELRTLGFSAQQIAAARAQHA